MAEPEGTFTCDVCGSDKPHSHHDFDVVQERFARKAFEERYTTTSTSSWDGDTHVSAPQRRSPEVSAGYWGEENNRRWHTYVSAWYDAWKRYDDELKGVRQINSLQAEALAEERDMNRKLLARLKEVEGSPSSVEVK